MNRGEGLMLNIGVIGFGSRANGVVGMMLDRAGDEVRLAAELCLSAKKSSQEHIFVDINL